MELNGMRRLYNSMKTEGIDRTKFDFKFRDHKIDVIYFIDEIPHKLAIGILSDNYYFEIDVNKGFQIKPYIDDYSRFCKIMGFSYNPESPFSPVVFFSDLNNAVPQSAKSNKIPEPNEVALFRRDVEESEKIYFVGWLDNKKRGNKVSDANLEKTKKLLSVKAYDMCKQKNISSRWSDMASDQRKYKYKNLEDM